MTIFWEKVKEYNFIKELFKRTLMFDHPIDLILQSILRSSLLMIESMQDDSMPLNKYLRIDFSNIDESCLKEFLKIDITFLTFMFEFFDEAYNSDLKEPLQYCIDSNKTVDRIYKKLQRQYASKENNRQTISSLYIEEISSINAISIPIDNEKLIMDIFIGELLYDRAQLCEELVNKSVSDRFNAMLESMLPFVVKKLNDGANLETVAEYLSEKSGIDYAFLIDFINNSIETNE